jgi:outer membrane protein
MSETNRMRSWTFSTRGVFVCLAAAAGGCLASCTTVDTTSITDFIGPATTSPQVRQAATTRPARREAASQPSTPAVLTTQPDGAMQLTITNAILMALENNRSLVAEKLNPQIKRTTEQLALAAFDPLLNGRLAYTRNRRNLPAVNDVIPLAVTEGAVGQFGVQEFLPTGTTLNLAGESNVTQGGFDEDDDYVSRAELAATQALLRGAGVDVNLVTLRQARLDTLTSQYELRGFAQELVAQVEETYWDCVLAQRQIEIVENAYLVAQQQYDEVKEFVGVGKLSPTELAAAEAEVALRSEELINARSALETTRLKLAQLLNPPRGVTGYEQIKLQTLPTTEARDVEDVSQHVELAMRMRPDLNQARLLVQRNELELVRTRNGLLPRLDLFVTFGKTGYADSFGRSVHNVGGSNYDVLVGISGEYAPINRDARAKNTRAILSREQALASLDTLEQLAEVDVRDACIELTRSKEQVRATAATRRLQEVTVRAETEKLRLGKSTSLLVAAAQRDLLSSQIAEVRAVVTNIKAMVELYRLEGSLLEHRGIACPGAEPVNPTAPPAGSGL